MGAVIVGIVTLSFVFTFLVFVPNSEQRRENFINDCERQSGNYVKLNRRSYCIIDGEVIG